MERTQRADAATAKQPMYYTVLLICGGGILGHDYAKGMQIDVATGIFLGALISYIAKQILTYILQDRDKKIYKTCTEIGTIVGIVIGSYICILGNVDGFLFYILGAGIGGVIGHFAGEMVASSLGMIALILLLFSQGPLGFITRKIIGSWLNGDLNS